MRIFLYVPFIFGFSHHFRTAYLVFLDYIPYLHIYNIYMCVCVSVGGCIYIFFCIDERMYMCVVDVCLNCRLSKISRVRYSRMPLAVSFLIFFFFMIVLYSFVPPTHLELYFRTVTVGATSVIFLATNFRVSSRSTTGMENFITVTHSSPVKGVTWNTDERTST